MRGTVAGRILAGLVTLVGMTPTQARSLKGFTATSLGGSSSCGTTSGIQGTEPASLKWLAGSYAWSLAPNMQWLTQFTQK